MEKLWELKSNVPLKSDASTALEKRYMCLLYLPIGEYEKPP